MLNLIAANDAVFYRARCRTLPIATSVTSVPSYPSKLTIFLTNASRFWQVRCYFDGQVVIRSLRTTHHHRHWAISVVKGPVEDVAGCRG